MRRLAFPLLLVVLLGWLPAVAAAQGVAAAQQSYEVVGTRALGMVAPLWRSQTTARRSIGTRQGWPPRSRGRSDRLGSISIW